MALFRRRMEYDFKQVTAVKPLTQDEALGVIDGCRDPLFKSFAREIYTHTYNTFQPQNTKLMIGFREASTRNPVFLINNASAPFNGFGAEAIVNPPAGIKVHFPTISTNVDGTLNIEIKYDLPPEPVLRKREDRSASRSRSESPKPRRSSRYSPERTPRPSRLKQSSSGSEEKPPARGRGRRSESVARELPPPPRASSKSRGRPARRKQQDSSNGEEEEKKATGFFSFFA
jgi:hypothetical protein